MASKLDRYRSMRSFERTPEPAGDAPDDAGAEGRFVIQEHHATRLHWDLRLEHGGALASWAVPNGIPDDPDDNRKAVHTEDHPLEYLEFHGEIPKGQYGAGTMTIWDRGTYTCEKWEPRKVVVVLHGECVRGRYALFHTGPDEKDWMIHRMDPGAGPREAIPERLLPMLATPGALPREDGGWAYEVKWDGVRAIAYSEPGRLRLESRNLNDITARYPEVRPLNRALSHHRAVLDGEIVAFDARGRPSFELLQGRMHLTSDSVVRRRAREAPVVYVIFDLLFLDGESLLRLPYGERRERLAALDLDGDTWRTPRHHVGEGAALLAAAREQGLEGIVAKRLEAPYEPGRRSPAWVKVKNTTRQELVIGGWLPGEGRRRERIGALLVGYWERGDDGRAFRYAGRVGTGFDEAELRRLAELLQPLVRDESPFAGRQPPKGAVWVEPRLVAEVEFNAWTAARMLRHPSYKGLRDDRDPQEVVLEAAHGTMTAVTEPTQPAAATATALGPSLAELKRDARRLPDGALELTVEGRPLRLTNEDKVLYPRAGFTKGQLADFYARISPVLLPHLHDRPLTLKRYPDGVEAEHFYEKQCPKHRPEWVTTAPVYVSQRRGEIAFCIAADLPTLVWLANLADIELHTSLSLKDPIERPTVLAFDLDPGEPADIVACCRVALLLKPMFEHLGLRSFPKTSGSKGLQVYVPLNTDVTYDETKPFARAVAELLEKQEPDLVVARMTKSLRPGKVFVDWSQNDEHKTTVCVYSLRARERPTVSTPVAWEEVERCAAEGDPEALRFDFEQVLRRVEELGDLFAPVLSLRQQLPRFGG